MLLAALLLAQAPVLADLTVPGHRDIAHQLVLEWESGTLGDRVLVAAPVRGLGGATLLAEGSPFDFSTKYGTRIYALPIDTVVPEVVMSETWRAWTDAHPSSAPPVTEIRSVPWAHPVGRVGTTLVLDEVGDDPMRVSLGVIRHERWSENGRPLGSTDPRPLVILLSTAGVVGLIWTSRRGRQGRSEGGAA